MVAQDWQQGHEAAAHIVLLGCLENRKDGELNSQTLTLTSRDLCHLTGFCFLKRQQSSKPPRDQAFRHLRFHIQPAAICKQNFARWFGLGDVLASPVHLVLYSFFFSFLLTQNVLSGDTAAILEQDRQ